LLFLLSPASLSNEARVIGLQEWARSMGSATFGSAFQRSARAGMWVFILD